MKCILLNLFDNHFEIERKIVLANKILNFELEMSKYDEDEEHARKFIIRLKN